MKRKASKENSSDSRNKKSRKGELLQNDIDIESPIRNESEQNQIIITQNNSESPQPSHGSMRTASNNIDIQDLANDTFIKGIKSLDPNDAWNLVPLQHRPLLIANFVQTLESVKATKILLDFPIDLIKKYFTTDIIGYVSLTLSCKALQKKLPGYHVIYKENPEIDITGPGVFKLFVNRMLIRIEKRTGKKWQIETRRTFDEKTRYIHIMQTTDRAYCLFRIDKDTGLIVGMENKPKARGYISMENIEKIVTKKGNLESVKELIDKGILTKEYQAELQQTFDENTKKQKDTKSKDKKKLRGAHWDESAMRKNKLGI